MRRRSVDRCFQRRCVRGTRERNEFRSTSGILPGHGHIGNVPIGRLVPRPCEDSGLWDVPRGGRSREPGDGRTGVSGSAGASPSRWRRTRKTHFDGALERITYAAPHRRLAHMPARSASSVARGPARADGSLGVPGRPSRLPPPGDDRHPWPNRTTNRTLIRTTAQNRGSGTAFLGQRITATSNRKATCDLSQVAF